MSIKAAYDQWADTYDNMPNKTRDLELQVMQEILGPLAFPHVLEIGCGTGKNTSWLAGRSERLFAMDFSKGMLSVAKEKVTEENVQFLERDITASWNLQVELFDLITCSLVLEHIEELVPIFQQAESHLNARALFYVCELHPYKQYAGKKANFIESGQQVEIDSTIHHISDYTRAARNNGLSIKWMSEHFESASELPRLISFLFEKS